MLHSKKDPIPSVHNWSNPHTQYPSGVNARLRVWRDDRSLVVCAYMRFVRRDGTKELGSAQLDAHVSSHKHTQGERERESSGWLSAGSSPDFVSFFFLSRQGPEEGHATRTQSVTSSILPPTLYYLYHVDAAINTTYYSVRSH